MVNWKPLWGRTVVVVILLLGMVLANVSSVVYAVAGPWTQTDWSGGSGQTAWSDATKFSTSTGVTTSVSGQVTLQSTSNWYNTSWLYRKKITFDNSAQASNLTNFPVLVKLTALNFDFSKTQTAGQDIRFTDSNGTTVLSYEIEKWNNAGSAAEVWVKVPQIDSSSNTDNIYLYYGNGAASDGQDVDNTWNSNFAMVQHLEETGACAIAFTDSTLNNNDMGCGSTPTATTGQIDGARSFDGIDDALAAADVAAFTNSQLTVSLWANQTALTTSKTFISKWFYSSQGSWTIQTDGSDNTRLKVSIADSLTDVGGNYALTDSGSWSTGWHQVAFSYNGAGSGNSGKLKIYIDGVAQNLTYTGTIPATLPDSDTFLRLAYMGNVGMVWNGGLDEVDILTTPLAPEWIAASYKSGADTFNTFASEESQVATSGTLTSSIYDTENALTWGTLTYSLTTPSNTSGTVKVRTSNSATMVGATAFVGCTAISSGSDISANGCVTDGHRYVQYEIGLANTDSLSTPTFNDISIAYDVPAATPAPTSAPASSSSSNSFSPVSAPECTDLPPTTAPNLFQIDAAGTYLNMYFTKAGGSVTAYNVSYGLDLNANHYGDRFNFSTPEWVIGRTISQLTPNTTYYFRVQGVNGCNGGPWSQVVQAKTKGRLANITKFFANLNPFKVAPTPENTPVKLVKPTIESCNYTAVKGDSLWLIAQKKWGTGSRYTEILSLNPTLSPGSILKIGQPLLLCK